MSSYFVLDWWTLWGLAAQFLFLSSFIVQWYKSERLKISHLPREFWYLRLVGSLMLIVYVLQRRDAVFFAALLLQILIYARNLVLLKKHKEGNVIE